MFGCKLNSQLESRVEECEDMIHIGVMSTIGSKLTVIGCCEDSGALLVSWCHETTHASVAPLHQCCFSQQLQPSVKVTGTNQHSLPLTNPQNREKMSLKIRSKNMTFEIFSVSELSNLAIYCNKHKTTKFANIIAFSCHCHNAHPDHENI